MDNIEYLKTKNKALKLKKNLRKRLFWIFFSLWLVCFAINLNSVGSIFNVTIENIVNENFTIAKLNPFQVLVWTLTLPFLVLWIVYAFLWGGASKEIKRIESEIMRQEMMSQEKKENKEK